MTFVRAEGRTPLHSGTGATAAWTTIAAVAIAVLALNMPPEGFFSGDPGVKLIAAFNAVDHPSRPFQIDLPRVGGEPRPWVDRFFQVHGDHAHALQSPLFPVLSAPFIAVAGLRGAYLLPALSFVLLVPLIERLRRALVPSVSPHAAGISAVLASPILFYALEFWEHVPAIAALAGVTVLLVPRAGSANGLTVRAIAAGALAAAATLLRPEAAWYAAGLCVALRLRPGAFAGLAAGSVMILVPFAAANVLHSGGALGPHAAANLAPLGDAWLATRIHRASLWLVPSSPVALSGLALIALAWIARIPPIRRDLAWMGLLGALLIAGAAALGTLPRESLWTAWPVGALLLAGIRRDPGRDVLLLTGAIAMLGVWLTSTHDGGAQWGPRFLLIASPALILLAAAAAQDLVSTGRNRLVAGAVVVLIGVCGLAISRLAYRELRASKRYYARVTEATARLTPRGGYVLTDVWWLDQITAALHRGRTVLVTPEPDTSREAVDALERAGVASVVAVTSSEEPSRLLDAFRETCFRVAASEPVRERSLTFHTIRCVAPDGLR